MRWRRKTKTEAPALKAAKDERKYSEKLHAEALKVAHELEHIRERNHFADALRAIIDEDQ